MLSYEVWKKIVSYLPVGEAKELYKKHDFGLAVLKLMSARI